MLDGPDYFGRLAICARNGLAVVNHNAIPTPMMNDASIRPTSRNILVCSSFISSGWRAADSRYLLPMTPMPMQAPMAPRPMMRPAASATRPMSSMLTPVVGERGWKKGGKASSVGFVRLADVDQCQHHEHEGLQRDDQDVEDGPHGAGDDVPGSEREPGD